MLVHLIYREHTLSFLGMQSHMQRDSSIGPTVRHP